MKKQKHSFRSEFVTNLPAVVSDETRETRGQGATVSKVKNTPRESTPAPLRSGDPEQSKEGYCFIMFTRVAVDSILQKQLRLQMFELALFAL